MEAERVVNPGSSEVALREKVLYHSNWEGKMSRYIHYTVYTRAIDIRFKVDRLPMATLRCSCCGKELDYPLQPICC